MYCNRAHKLVVKMSKLFAVLCMRFLRINYFDGSTKIFSNLYLAKFLDTYFSKTNLFV